MASQRVNTTLGILGAVLLVLFYLGMISPEWTTAIVGRHGLLFWGGMLIGAITLPAIAAMRGSKWWFALVGVSVITTFGVLALALK
jgi:hypothetical protein